MIDDDFDAVFKERVINHRSISVRLESDGFGMEAKISNQRRLFKENFQIKFPPPDLKFFHLKSSI